MRPRKRLFFRNLTKEEILLQILSIIDDEHTNDLFGEGFEVSFMGMGEPLANLRNVLAAIKEIQWLYPQITCVSVSTAGPAKRIDCLTEAMPVSPPVHLQISLHATKDEVRKRLVPYAPDSIANLLSASRRFHERTRDQVYLNYVLLRGINDSVEDARWLGQLDREAFYVKISGLNLIPELPSYLVPASVDEILAFSEVLGSYGMPHKIFVGDGLDVQASCGQLAATAREIHVASAPETLPISRREAWSTFQQTLS